MSTSAYRVASLLRQENNKLCSDKEKNTLARLTRDVEAFLDHAADVPPVAMETPYDDGETDLMEVHLSVVAGVLEPCEPASDVTAVDGVFMPTAKNHVAMDRKRVREAQAMLNLLGALSTDCNMPTASVAATTRCRLSLGSGEKADFESDDESIAVFDADELENDTSSSDGEINVHGRPPPRILELN
ncbi:hypothetical protein TCDM_14151 [Trypanosoma cruzi Dm28c]|uniref:Uncharacterized protein n=2 Tax=Trypanosoma cruzi TaxID=5693 RepID=V5BD49_TRYCR|nr:hypothetical protein TCDM_14151 [Trypanosoma cruzi Dm28c]KAF8283887.1 hypothetical protein TcBrA4_0061690 [Trypanosoma cruzi]PBJ73259.1 hypothetical protein BCY84_14131 [Trypanosoma cruzi cruzi]PWV02492.1 hypothetical protein C4B63_2g717 [Trypanosoma cruzi]